MLFKEIEHGQRFVLTGKLKFAASGLKAYKFKKSSDTQASIIGFQKKVRIKNLASRGETRTIPAEEPVVLI